MTASLEGNLGVVGEMPEHQRGLVSVIVPTFNNEQFIEKCLESIADQSYSRVEAIIVDGFSTDRTVEIARKFDSEVHLFGVKSRRESIFGAPYQRNYGVSKSRGEFVYYVDVDMQLTRDVITGCVRAINTSRADGVIVPETSFGTGFWSACRSLDRRCHAGDDLQEAPRFFKKEVWEKLNGLDPTIGGDDWDLYLRFKRQGFKAARVTSTVLHNEGKLSIKRLALKRYMYGKQLHNYLQRHRGLGFRQFSPIREGYFKNRQLFERDPVHATGLAVMRTVEYTATVAGMVIGKIMPYNPTLSEGKYVQEEGDRGSFE
jgi:glycosyltransferase involved in cell wall biosynthesis